MSHVGRLLVAVTALGAGCKSTGAGSLPNVSGPGQTTLERATQALRMHALAVQVAAARTPSRRWSSVREARDRAVLASSQRRLEETLWVPAGDPAAPRCTPSQLRPGVAWFQGATGTLLGGATLLDRSRGDCTLEGTPAVALLTANGAPITAPNRPLDLATLGWLPWRGRPTVALRPGQSTTVWLRWFNDCAGTVARSVRITVDGGSIAVPLSPGNGVTRAPCVGPGSPAALDVSIFTPEQRR